MNSVYIMKKFQEYVTTILQFQIKVGLLVSAVCMAVLILFLKSYSLLIFDLDSIPDWAFNILADMPINSTSTTNTSLIHGTL